MYVHLKGEDHEKNNVASPGPLHFSFLTGSACSPAKSVEFVHVCHARDAAQGKNGQGVDTGRRNYSEAGALGT